MKSILKNKRILITAVLVLYGLSTFAQSGTDQQISLSKEWINTNVHNIEKEENIQAWAFLKEEIKDRRIVAIGEQMHQDGESFRLRGQMIEYLMEEMGFEVILFEAGMYDVQEANSIARQEQSIDSLKKGLYSFWSRAEQHEQLFNYLQNRLDNRENVSFDGFDCKFTSSYG